MSGLAVVIGFILLLPSTLGMIFSALILFGVLFSGGGEAVRVQNEAIAHKRNSAVPALLVAAVVAGRDADVEGQSKNGKLARSQRSWVGDAQEKIRESDMAAGGAVLFGGGYAVAFGIACFVGGLLGWLPAMKKRVLQRSLCGAVVNAS